MWLNFSNNLFNNYQPWRQPWTPPFSAIFSSRLAIPSKDVRQINVSFISLSRAWLTRQLTIILPARYYSSIPVPPELGATTTSRLQHFLVNSSRDSSASSRAKAKWIIPLSFFESATWRRNKQLRVSQHFHVNRRLLYSTSWISREQTTWTLKLLACNQRYSPRLLIQPISTPGMNTNRRYVINGFAFWCTFPDW